MRISDPLVSIGLPVRNGAGRLATVVESVLTQSHEHLELVISDNASTDGTGELCRDLAKLDSRVVYLRQPENVGLLNNFVQTIQRARGTFFAWVGDDNWLAPAYVSRCLQAFAENERLILVTTQMAYVGPYGVARGGAYDGVGLRSLDPVTRFAEMLRLLNASHLQIDPLYGLMRRVPAATIARRNMLREDEVFAAKLALAGPWGHVPEVLASRTLKHERLSVLAGRLGVPRWQAYLADMLQCREILRWLRDAELTPVQRRRAQAAVVKMYVRRQRRNATRRSAKLVRLLTAPLRSGGV